MFGMITDLPYTHQHGHTHIYCVDAHAQEVVCMHKRLCVQAKVPKELATLIFNEERDDTHIVFVKGADSVIFPRCTESDLDVLDQAQEDMIILAKQSLRTLILAHK